MESEGGCIPERKGPEGAVPEHHDGVDDDACGVGLSPRPGTPSALPNAPSEASRAGEGAWTGEAFRPSRSHWSVRACGGQVMVFACRAGTTRQQIAVEAIQLRDMSSPQEKVGDVDPNAETSLGRD